MLLLLDWVRFLSAWKKSSFSVWSSGTLLVFLVWETIPCPINLSCTSIMVCNWIHNIFMSLNNILQIYSLQTWNWFKVVFYEYWYGCFCQAVFFFLFFFLITQTLSCGICNNWFHWQIYYSCTCPPPNLITMSIWSVNIVFWTIWSCATKPIHKSRPIVKVDLQR